MSTDPQTQDMDPTVYAELVADANDVINALENGVRRTGALFAAASAVTVAALALDLRPVADVVAVVAVVAFLAALVILTARISLGGPPEALDPGVVEVAGATPADVVEGPANGSGTPATGSGPATATNRRILRK